MADLIEAPSGLEGVIAFQTEVAQPDKEGGCLRYRGVYIEDLAGRIPFEMVRGLLVDVGHEPGRLVRPTARCVGPAERAADSVDGATRA
ncbi:MAG: hypothetical protein ICV69_06515 [Thermoleophilaceae bacterium]|nr:hypothetical protein [Thermoleophilaceae bacterium]